MDTITKNKREVLLDPLGNQVVSVGSETCFAASYLLGCSGAVAKSSR